MAQQASPLPLQLAVLPEPMLREILRWMDAEDLERLGQTSKLFLRLSRDETLWAVLAQDVFGVTLDLQKRLTEAGVEFAEAHRRIVDAPESWRGLFKQRTMLLKGTDDDRVERMYSQVQNFLEGLQDEASGEEVGVVASMLLDILDVMPYHIPSFYSLAYICFLLNAFDECQHLIDTGLLLDAKFRPLLDLQSQLDEELERIDDADDDEEDAPLLDERARPSEELKIALREIFTRFDVDKDGALSHAELTQLIRTLNGSDPSPTTLRNLTRNFKSNKKNALLLDGFVEFYRRQTVDDPEETRADLAKLGYNRALQLSEDDDEDDEDDDEDDEDDDEEEEESEADAEPEE